MDKMWFWIHLTMADQIFVSYCCPQMWPHLRLQALLLFRMSTDSTCCGPHEAWSQKSKRLVDILFSPIVVHMSPHWLPAQTLWSQTVRAGS
jgi:hypothetical protein